MSRYPEFNDQPQTRKVATFVGQQSLADVIKWANSVGLMAHEVMFSSGHVYFQKTETADEVERRREGYEATKARHAEFIRERYAELFPAPVSGGVETQQTSGTGHTDEAHTQDGDKR